MGHFNNLVFLVGGSTARISLIFQTSVAVACSYILFHNDSSRLWRYWCLDHRIVSRCPARKYLWWECYGALTDRLFIISISPSNKSFSHVANDVICSAIAVLK